MRKFLQIFLEKLCRIKINAYLCTIKVKQIGSETHYKLYKIMTTISKYQIRWAIIDTMSKKKVFKYQVEALKKIGFAVIQRMGQSAEICKHYRNEEAVIADAANIRLAYEIVTAKRSSAIGSIITDAQFGSVKDGESTIVKTTTKQQEFFRALVGQQNHPYSDYQPEMF